MNNIQYSEIIHEIIEKEEKEMKERLWNLIEWLNNYSSQNEERIKDMIDGSEIIR